MKIFGKKSAFTLSEILITLGVIGTISAMTIPTLAYNYRSKVLEEQYRTTYSDIREIGSRLNYDKGDVGTYANKTDFGVWQRDFMAMLNGGNNLFETPTPGNIKQKLKDFYRDGGGSPGPYYFHMGTRGREEAGGAGGTDYLCDNGSIWTDSRGRVWTFNDENRIICVDINGSANPNTYNIDIFSFVPMDAEMVATWVYNDPDNPENYSGAIIPCDIEQQHRHNLGNTKPTKTDGKYEKGTGSALDYCPFFEPIENIAPMNSYKPGKSSRNKTVTANDNYWKAYIDYK